MVQEIIALTETGRAMLAGSHWMTIWITELLQKAGVSLDDISWNAVAGEDELDIVVNIGGTRAFFELKDREFGLGDAYPFAARVSRYGGDIGVVISTNRIADEAKSFLTEQRPGVATIPFYMIEDVPSAGKEISSLVNRLSQAAIRRRVAEIAAPLGMSMISILELWLRERGRSKRPP